MNKLTFKFFKQEELVMGKSKKAKKMIVSLLILLFLVSVPQFVFAYGGGGDSQSSREDTPQTKIYTREELEEIFKGLPEGLKELVIDKQVGKERTKAQLIKILKIFLEAQNFKNQAESIDANAWADLVGYWTDLAIFLDKRGQDAEFILSFVPGAGWMSGTAFGTVRAGISKYSEGKGIGDIAQAMAVSVAVDQVMKLGSLSKLGKRGDALVDMIARADKLKRNPAVNKYLRSVGAKLLGYKLTEKYTKDMIGKVIDAIATSAQNTQVTNTRPPSQMNYMGPGPYDVTNTGQKLYK
jgi:hypothetical protein